MTEKLTPRRLVGILLVVTASGFGAFWLVRAGQHPDTIENAL